MSDSPNPEFTEAYAQDVKARFEHLEKQLADLVAFARQLGHTPSK